MDTAQWLSPYQYRKNALLYLPDGLPDPRAAGYAEVLAQNIASILKASQGRAFCLFTSYAMMRKVYQLSSGQSNWPLMMQGEASRSELLDRFIDTPHAVLFGTSSFWQGVDVRGDQLSCVIIDKLPFASPADPVLKGRLEAFEAEGQNPFMDYQLPAAVIALRQGVGRLIRSEDDRGVLAIADSRLVSKSYGKVFLNSLPAMSRTRSISDVEAFFK